ncbi:P1 family peptidase [Chloroflexota bacterium]
MITQIAGIKVGHYTDLEAATGCTVILCEEGAVGGIDVRGSAAGTRETDLLRPMNLVERVYAVLLSGGSVLDLNAAQGVMRYLEEEGIGYDTTSV